MRRLQAVDDSFFEAKDVIVVGGELPASCARVFDVLAAPEPWPEWLKIVRRVEYTTPPPRAVGCRRDVWSFFGMIREHFFRWEPGRGFSFYVYETSYPALLQFAEDYRLTELAPDRCRLDWRTRMVTASWAAPGAAVVHAGFAREARAAVPRLARWLESH